MNENPENVKLNEQQTDALLTAFYRREIPARLDSLPSTWPQVNQQSSDLPGKVVPAVAPAAARPTSAVPAGTSTGRGIVVAASTLAACLMILALSNVGGPAVTSSATTNSVEPPDATAPDALMNVSENPQGSTGAVDEDGLTLDDLEVDLNPAAPESKSTTETEDDGQK